MQVLALEDSTLVVDVDVNNSVGTVRIQLEAMTGIPYDAQQLVLNGQHVDAGRNLSEHEIRKESTLSLVLKGRGGMSDAPDADEPQKKRRRIAESGVDAAFEDLCILRRCTYRIHRFSPGVAGRDLLRDGDQCASLGHWSLIMGHCVDPSTVSSSSLHAACFSGQADAIDSLVSHYGIDVNDRDDAGGWTALHTAMCHGNALVCDRLLALGAEDVATDDGVHASSLRPELWRRLTGSDRGMIDRWAPPGSVQEAVSELVEMVNEENVSTEALCRRVCCAVEKVGMGVLEELDTVLRQWVRRWSLLTAAAKAGLHSLCRVCVELGADVVRTNESDETPLCIACHQGKLDCARLLLDRGAVVNKANCDSWTPLYIACMEGQLDCARLLLDRGAEVGKADDRGWTPLHMACWFNHRHVAALLLSRGAELTKRTFGGGTPAYYACACGPSDPELVDAMLLATVDRAAAIERLWGMDARGPLRR